MHYVTAGVRRPGFLTLVLLASLAGSACTAVPPMANVHASPEGLADSMLDALRAQDRAALELFALSEQEFRDHVWPALESEQPGSGVGFADVWGGLKQRSDAALDDIMARHGGRSYELVEIGFAGETDHGTYRIRRDIAFHVRTRDGGTEGLRMAGSFIEKGDAWKVFSYAVEE
jgi:hypothetical protein